jgi:hypothetical protein
MTYYPELALEGSLTCIFQILAGGSRSWGASNGSPYALIQAPVHPSAAHLLRPTAQPGSGWLNPQLWIAATAQVQRRKRKMIMSRFRHRIARISTFIHGEALSSLVA